MKTNHILIGVGVLVAGFIAYKFLWNKDEEKSNACGCSSNIISSVSKLSGTKLDTAKYSVNGKGCGCGCGCDKA